MVFDASPMTENLTAPLVVSAVAVSVYVFATGGSSLFRCHCPLSGVCMVLAISASSSDTVGTGLVPAFTSPNIS